MSYLLNDPVAFADEMIDGFVAANSHLVRRVLGGVARRSRTPGGQVAVVVGGGSGHYPAFAGFVGQGLAHGAAMGNVFASPSAKQIHAVARSVASDAGVLFTYGNYAGDVLNFDQAQDRLNAEGIPCRTVVVTDDISSADEEERHKRRGIAGDLVVFKAAAWAAQQGRSLHDVWSLTNDANERTRTLGVAFSGCTLPGASEPLFTVPPGHMAVGMGIHGEPGIEEASMPSAAELADLLVSRLLAARPEAVGEVRGARAAVILNGLGSVKFEELFITYRSVASLLDEAGVTIVQPEVGELVTSFEMAGVSLSLCWLDEALEAAWISPVETPAYRRGVIGSLANAEAAEYEAPSRCDFPVATTDSQEAAGHVVSVLRAVKQVIDEHAGELGRLDAIAGDGDHGIGMQRGSRAALQAAQAASETGAGAGATLAAAGDAWADRGGGTSGALWGIALRAIGAQVGDRAKPDGQSIAAGMTDATNAIARYGRANLGDKTMLDAIVPFTGELVSRIDAGGSLAGAWSVAADVATTAAHSTAGLIPRIGRARPHMERSVGTPDPGAVSFALAANAVAGALTRMVDA